MKYNDFNKTCILLALTFCAAVSPLSARGTIVHDSISSSALEGNLVGDSPEREVSIYLPQGYSESTERYPVIYLLHGYLTGIKNRVWLLPEIQIDVLLDSLFQNEGLRPCIVVLPDGDNRFHGSWYGSSEVIGDYETYIVTEIPEFMERRYRVLPGRENRALAGHSMGGFGAAYLGMKYSDEYSAIGIMSGAVDLSASAEGVTSERDADSVPAGWREWFELSNWHTKVMYAIAAAFAPDPAEAPFFVGLPWRLEGGKVKADRKVLERFIENSPLHMISGYRSQLLDLKGIIMTCGTEDFLITQSEDMHDVFQRYQIRHEYYLMSGNHISVMPASIKAVVRYFSQILKYE